MDELTLALFVFLLGDDRLDHDAAISLDAAVIRLLRSDDCGCGVRHVSVAIRDLQQHADGREFNGERLLEFGIAVVAAIATAVFHDHVSTERRREDMLVRETDGIPLPFPQAEQALRHVGILLRAIGEYKANIL